LAFFYLLFLGFFIPFDVGGNRRFAKAVRTATRGFRADPRNGVCHHDCNRFKFGRPCSRRPRGVPPVRVFGRVKPWYTALSPNPASPFDSPGRCQVEPGGMRQSFFPGPTSCGQAPDPFGWPGCRDPQPFAPDGLSGGFTSLAPLNPVQVGGDDVGERTCLQPFGPCRCLGNPPWPHRSPARPPPPAPKLSAPPRLPRSRRRSLLRRNPCTSQAVPRAPPPRRAAAHAWTIRPLFAAPGVLLLAGGASSPPHVSLPAGARHRGRSPRRPPVGSRPRRSPFRPTTREPFPSSNLRSAGRAFRKLNLVSLDPYPPFSLLAFVKSASHEEPGFFNASAKFSRKPAAPPPPRASPGDGRRK